MALQCVSLSHKIDECPEVVRLQLEMLLPERITPAVRFQVARRGGTLHANLPLISALTLCSALASD